MDGHQQIYDFIVDPNNPRTTYYWQLKFAEGAKSILEIGCSNGFLSRVLVSRGAQVMGVENNPEAGKQAQGICQAVIIGDIEDPSVQEQIGEKFDVVLLGDVLEHLRNPESVLVYIRENWLAPGGRVVTSIPNSAHWIFRREVLLGRFPYRGYGLFDQTHLRFFTRKTFDQLVQRAGFTIKKLTLVTNFNTLDDITFKSLTSLYHVPFFHKILNRFEVFLANMIPNLFAYQYVISLFPTKAE